MSNRKSKQNDENLCPIASKRSKSATNSPIKPLTNSQQTWTAAKLESTSSPTGLSNEYLEEMGVVLLSEESSSSASSAISFAALTSVGSNTDENYNEATPNLDAPKFLHHRQNRPSPYVSLDPNEVSSDGINPSTESNVQDIANYTNNNSNNSFEIFTDESELSKNVSLRKPLAQHKKVALLSASPDKSTSHNGRKRSPLATVISNNHPKTSSLAPQQQSPVPQQLTVLRQNDNSRNSSNNCRENESTANHDSVPGTANFSPSQPSTSQQAALIKQQQQLTLLKILKLQQIEYEQSKPQSDEIQPGYVEDFFLFRNRQMRNCTDNADKTDYFSLISDEIILHIFKWLPKKTLLRCSSVCRRFQQCAADESLWTRLDLGSRSLRPEIMDHILSRGVVILRLAQANMREPVFESISPNPELKSQSKLQFLDLSLAQIEKKSLKTLLSYCRQLKKLSLEHVPLNNEICNEIAENTNLEALNLAMCSGLEAWSVRKMFEPLKNLNSLNISWTNLSVDAVTALVTNVTPNLMRLNVAGCRKTMFDTHISSLSKRCPQLLELDLSDCTGLTGSVINILCGFKVIEYLSLSRCYLIPAMSYLDLKYLHSLAFLDVFGTLSDPAMDLLVRTFPGLGINKFVHSSVARPTVGTRRTSIWGLRTRD